MCAILVLLFIAIIGGVVGGNILLKKQSDKLTTLKVENKTIDMQQTALAQAKKDIEKYNELDQIAQNVVPQDKDQAKTVREIVKLADQNGVPIKSVTFQASTLGDNVKSAAPAANGQPAAKVPTTTQVKPVEGISGVYTLEIQVASSKEVLYQNFLNFLESLEKNRRTAHVVAINLDPSDDGKRLDFNLTLNAYVRQ